jgi:hypothetical protein
MYVDLDKQFVVDSAVNVVGRWKRQRADYGHGSSEHHRRHENRDGHGRRQDSDDHPGR